MKLLLQQLRNEVWKLFAKKRTYIGFLMFLLAQLVIMLLVRFTDGPQRSLRFMLEGNGHVAGAYLSALTFASFMVMPIAWVLLPLYASLVGGDLVAKEVEDGTLRMILSRPVSRLRVLALKWSAGAVFSVVLVLVLGLFGLGLARLCFPWGSLFVFVPNELFSLFEPGAGLRAYAAAHVLMATKAVTVMGLAFMFSCFNVKPAAATILGLSFVFVNFILMNLEFLRDLRPWFLTYHLNLWQLMFGQPIPWWRVLGSLSLLAGFNVTFFVVGATAFQVRDIKS